MKILLMKKQKLSQLCEYIYKYIFMVYVIFSMVYGTTILLCTERTITKTNFS